MMLHENDWQAINNILLKMYSEKCNRLFDGSLMKNLKYLIPYDKASFYLHNHDPEGPILRLDCPETAGFNPDTYEQFIPMVPVSIPHSWVNFYEKSLVIRDSDICIDENERMTKEYFKSLYLVENIKYGLTISLSFGKTRVGILTLFRNSDKEDFTDREVQIAEQLMDHIACYAYNIYNLEQYESKDKRHRTLGDLVEEYRITDREKDVLRLVLAGDSTREICDKLSISETTAKKHLGSIYGKLNIHSKSELFKILNFNLDE